MDLEDAIGAFLEHERERVQIQAGAEPDVFAFAHVDARLKLALPSFAYFAVHAVGAEEQIAFAGDALDVGLVNLALELETHAELATSRLQEPQELLASHAGEPVARRADTFAVDERVDVRPMTKRSDDGVVRRFVGGFEVRERLVAEDDAPPERLHRFVALVENDVVLRVRLLAKDCEVERGGAGADGGDAHQARP